MGSISLALGNASSAGIANVSAWLKRLLDAQEEGASIPARCSRTLLNQSQLLIYSQDRFQKLGAIVFHAVHER